MLDLTEDIDILKSLEDSEIVGMSTVNTSSFSHLPFHFTEVCTKSRKAILTSKRVRDLVER